MRPVTQLLKLGNLAMGLSRLNVLRVLIRIGTFLLGGGMNLVLERE